MIRVVVIGAGGYSGAELTGLLLGHPNTEVVGLFGSSRRGDNSQARFDRLYPRFRGRTDLTVHAMDLNEIASLAPDAVFLATPHEVSHNAAPTLLEDGLTVLDLSGAFRLADQSLYPQHYGFEHEYPALLRDAVYGLPELNRDELVGAGLIAVAGCYPTSIIPAVAPLISAGAIDTQAPVIADSISGVSGAGKSPSARSHFCEVSLEPYSVFTHRHGPEIDQHCGTHVIFTPHLGAFDRGILSTMHMQLAQGWTEDRVRALLDEKYGHEPFVRILDERTWPAISAVRYTNYCDIALGVDDADAHLIVVSALDNLIKGAAGQAVQCMNTRFGIPETIGLGQDEPCLIR